MHLGYLTELCMNLSIVPLPPSLADVSDSEEEEEEEVSGCASFISPQI